METTNTRKLALAAGVLYLVTFVASVPTLALKAPLVDHANWILGHGSDKGIILACLMDFVCGVAGIGTAVALYPIVRSFRPTAAIGFITSAPQAEQILRTGQADMVFVARELLRDPYWPLRAARELGTSVPSPAQYDRAWR